MINRENVPVPRGDSFPYFCVDRILIDALFWKSIFKSFIFENQLVIMSFIVSCSVMQSERCFYSYFFAGENRWKLSWEKKNRIKNGTNGIGIQYKKRGVEFCVCVVLLNLDRRFCFYHFMRIMTTTTAFIACDPCSASSVSSFENQLLESFLSFVLTSKNFRN